MHYTQLNATVGVNHAGVTYVAAPVFGRPDAALEHRVLFAVAGPKDAKQKLQKYFDWMGRGTLVHTPVHLSFSHSVLQDILSLLQAAVAHVAIALGCCQYSSFSLSLDPKTV